MTRSVKHGLITFFTFAGGFYFFLEFLLPAELGFGMYHDEISKGIQMIGVLTIGLGVINIARIHGGRVIRGQKGWGNSFALLSGMIAVFFVHGADIRLTERNLAGVNSLKTYELFVERILRDFTAEGVPAAPRLKKLLEDKDRVHRGILELLNTPQAMNTTAAKGVDELRSNLDATWREAELLHSLALKVDVESSANTVHEESRLRFTTAATALEARFRELQIDLRTTLDQLHQTSWPGMLSSFITNALFASLGSAMFSLLAFYIASASYRAFRVRSLEAVTMMLAATIVILGQIPFGPLYISESLPAWRMWLLQYVNVPAFRAIYFGAAIAALAMAVRMWLSLERSPLAAEDRAALSQGKGDE